MHRLFLLIGDEKWVDFEENFVLFARLLRVLTDAPAPVSKDSVPLLSVAEGGPANADELNEKRRKQIEDAGARTDASFLVRGGVLLLAESCRLRAVCPGGKATLSTYGRFY